MPIKTSEPKSEPLVRCDICGLPILNGEPMRDESDEIVHTSCVRNWFNRNFGRESLS